MPKAAHFEILVEEPSMESFLGLVLPKILGSDITFSIHAYQGKHDLFKKLSSRLRGYAQWLPADHRIVVLVDRDDDNCAELKARMERASADAGLRSRAISGTTQWNLVNRIAIEELEAWFFGDWGAVRRAYPRLPASVANKAPYRDSDAILGGTWEALERILKRSGYFEGGLRKVEFAQAVGREFDHGSCVSYSFTVFHDALVEAVG